MRLIIALLISFGIWTGALAEPLQPGDTISISVYQDSRLDRQLVVGPSGAISFPMAGQIRAAGMTPQALENELRNRLKDKFAGALDITVTLVAASKPDDDLKPRIFVTGEVNRPGPYVMRQRTTLMQAIALSGGLGPFAARQRIQVRRTIKGEESVHLFDYASYESGRNLTGNIDLRAGDVIIVPERGLFEIF
jgi:polysaccharide biosynthesis/export protein